MDHRFWLGLCASAFALVGVAVSQEWQGWAVAMFAIIAGYTLRAATERPA